MAEISAERASECRERKEEGVVLEEHSGAHNSYLTACTLQHLGISHCFLDVFKDANLTGDRDW